MKKFATQTVLAAMLGSVVLSGCATKTLMTKDSGGSYVKKTRQTLVEDSVLAFGKPATRIANAPDDAVVIVGQKHSYVLTQGGSEFTSLLGYLDPDYVSLREPLDFYSANNDGKFTGTLALKYTRLKEDFSKKDAQFFLKHNVKECTTYNEKELQAQSFCFNISLEGAVYPVVSNQHSLKSLSRLYPVTIYTTKEETAYRKGDSDPVEKLILFPFAVAFDVVTLPFQALKKIFN